MVSRALLNAPYILKWGAARWSLFVGAALRGRLTFLKWGAHGGTPLQFPIQEPDSLVTFMAGDRSQQGNRVI